MPLVAKSTARTERIVQAAGMLFARQGYHGTSTREIAYLAEVSENTVFRHFENKEDLFWLTLRTYFAGLKFRRDLLGGLENCDAPEIVLPKIIEIFASVAEDRPVLLRLISVAFIELHWKADAFCKGHLSPVFAAITHYLEKNVQNGKLPELDCKILTTALLSTALMHPWISSLIEDDTTVPLHTREAIRAYGHFWMDLLIPKLSLYLFTTGNNFHDFSE